MNCAEFRERLLIDPLDPAMTAAAQAGVCPDAEMQLKRAHGFERRLKQAMELDVPSDLALTIGDAVRRAAGQTNGAARMRRGWLAVAASVALGASVGGWWFTQDTARSLATECVAHLAHEPYALTRQQAVPEALVSRLFTEFGVALKDSPGVLQYSMPCKVGAYRALHLVAQLESGPVTVMYLPDPPELSRKDFRQDAVTGRIVPMGSGALVLLAEHGREFDPLEMRFRTAIEGLQTAQTVAGGI
jgi:hypothetical protein